ncbi:MAG: type II toxin-antitoxin system prevent-host-death family antitoxin [Cyanobacteria bacterium J06621_3]
MTIEIRDIHSLSDFQRNTQQYVSDLRTSHKPVVLTVNGEAALVVQDAAAYQSLLDELEIARCASVVKQRMEKFDRDGVDLDAKSAFEQLGKELGMQS